MARFCLLLLSFCTVSVYAQSLNQRYLAYIERYRAVALEQEESHGVPASITLAQGLLESNAGQSYLAQRGNNHFGIKCHNTWHGPSVEFDDTLRHACYRKYGSAEDSFLDHAKFLSTRRYSPLHDLDVTDYRGWAQGLRDCGYAEDPAYPQKLIALIEQYNLQDITSASASQTPPVDTAAAHPDARPDEQKAKSDVPPRRQVASEPSRAEIDTNIARRRPPRERLRRATANTNNASTDN